MESSIRTAHWGWQNQKTNLEHKQNKMKLINGVSTKLTSMGPLGPGALIAETALLMPADWRSRLLVRSVVIWGSGVTTRNQNSSTLHCTAALYAATHLLLRHGGVVQVGRQGTQRILGETSDEKEEAKLPISRFPLTSQSNKRNLEGSIFAWLVGHASYCSNMLQTDPYCFKMLENVSKCSKSGPI